MSSPKRAFLALVLTLCTIAAGYAQNEKIILPGKQLTGSEIFAQIEKQTLYKLAYDKSVFDVSKIIHVSNTRTDVKSLLERMFRNTDIGYDIQGNVIVLAKKRTYNAIVTQTSTGDMYVPTGLNGVKADANPRLQTGNVKSASDTVEVVEVVKKRKFPKSYSDYKPLETYTHSYKSLPVFALKTNLLYAGAALTPNISVEFGVSRKSTVSLSGSYTWYGREKDKVEDYKQFVHMILMPEYRYWLCERFNGHFFGVHALYGRYNISGHDVPLLFDKENRYDGHAYGGGVSYGYHLPLDRRWGLEFNIGVGYAYMNYDKFNCSTCDRNAVKTTKHYFGPTRAGVTLVFLIK